ncbi:hypothetical protein GQ53DRAFT_369727 [Thozetella sp. PMI_491]|nr:hypothetical protein GQ53DRAFT_369727 [Thozetella sp. PMI_491]
MFRLSAPSHGILIASVSTRVPPGRGRYVGKSPPQVRGRGHPRDRRVAGICLPHRFPLRPPHAATSGPTAAHGRKRAHTAWRVVVILLWAELSWVRSRQMGEMTIGRPWVVVVGWFRRGRRGRDMFSPPSPSTAYYILPTIWHCYLFSLAAVASGERTGDVGGLLSALVPASPTNGCRLDVQRASGGRKGHPWV